LIDGKSVLYEKVKATSVEGSNSQKSASSISEANFLNGNTQLEASKEESTHPEIATALHEEEERALGKVNTDVYLQYFKDAGGKNFLISLLVVFAASLAIRVVTNYWFVWWLSDSFGLNSGAYMAGYVLLTLIEAISLGKYRL